ncbi:MAG TPA: metallophosphoesterase [Pseudomonadales bacterium]|nr:metallophosphoesterase [Pseudomonadales bacterium]
MAPAALDSAPASASFEFAHLTDPHLTSLADVRAPLGDKRLLGWLSWRRKRRFRHLPERLAAIVRDIEAAGVHERVVTGDLTQIGLPQEVDAARAWLEALGGTANVTVVPGNHDLYVADPDDHMLARWAPWMSGDDGVAAFPFLRRRGPVAFIGLDSAAPSAPLLATGRLGDGQLQRLADLLQETGAAGYVRVLLVHHAPLPGLDPWRKRLTDAPALREVLLRHGAELVLHGHGHHFRVEALQTPRGAIPVIQGPSASSAARDGAHAAAWVHVRVRTAADHMRIELGARRAGADGEAHAFEFPRGA